MSYLLYTLLIAPRLLITKAIPLIFDGWKRGTKWVGTHFELDYLPLTATPLLPAYLYCYHQYTCSTTFTTYFAPTHHLAIERAFGREGYSKAFKHTCLRNEVW